MSKRKEYLDATRVEIVNASSHLRLLHTGLDVRAFEEAKQYITNALGRALTLSHLAERPLK